MLKDKKQKLNAVVARELSQQYRALSPEQYRLYEQAGIAATIAHRHGQRPFPRTGPASGPDPDQKGSPADVPPAPGTTTLSGAIVSMRENQPMEITAYTGKSFTEKYRDFKQSLKKEIDPVELTKEEENEFQNWQGDVAKISLAKDLDKTLERDSNTTASTGGFERMAMQTPGLRGLKWNPATGPLVQAGSKKCLLHCFTVKLRHVGRGCN